MSIPMDPLKCFWLGGVRDQKSQFWQISKFWPKKNLKSVTSKIFTQNSSKPKIPKNVKMVKTSWNNNFNPPNQDLRWLGLG